MLSWGSGLQPASAKGGRSFPGFPHLILGAGQLQLLGGCLCPEVSFPSVLLGGEGSLPGGAACPAAGGGEREGGEGKRILGEVQLVKAIEASERLGQGMHPHAKELSWGGCRLGGMHPMQYSCLGGWCTLMQWSHLGAGEHKARECTLLSPIAGSIMTHVHYRCQPLQCH